MILPTLDSGVHGGGRAALSAPRALVILAQPHPEAESKALPNISIKRRHKLPHKQARAAAQKIARDLNKRFELAYEWDGDDVAFERPGLSGTLHVGKTEVQLDVELSFLLLALKGPIEREIKKELDELFGKA